MNIRLFVDRWLAPAAILISIAALQYPAGFVWMKPHISILLGVIMFGMGMTLELRDFQRILQNPRLLAAGVLAQFVMMPLLGFTIARCFRFEPALLAGFVLLGACPGGTASNVMAYLARANVGLSVSLTLTSTLLAPLLTPWLTWLYAHQAVDVNAIALMKNIFWIVLFPLIDGLILRHFFRSTVFRFLDYFPLISAAIIVAVIGCVVGLNADHIRQVTALVALAVMLHNAAGLGFGYLVGKCVSRESAICRTMAFEVGMQNSGLAVALALQTSSFGAAAALPGALFSLWHNITGAALAGRWSQGENK
ncbi:MAG: bile acid:sodium symporter family protein [Candidatus Omnitrophota bacterium]|jgi:BASS family bile acid:Na+ symporter|nr:MAG: bile acid:sodium symporter family protein [Candidatus Omnitrophota bacterium]